MHGGVQRRATNNYPTARELMQDTPLKWWPDLD
jgi:hypothetical protein